MTKRDETDRYKSLHELNPRQLIALDALDAGARHAEAAREAGVNRTTVSRWASTHPEFIAELNRRRIQRAIENSQRIQGTTEHAIDLVAAAIQAGNVRAALDWLRIVGTQIATDKGNGETDSAQVIERFYHEARRNFSPLGFADPAGRERLLDQLLKAAAELK